MFFFPNGLDPDHEPDKVSDLIWVQMFCKGYFAKSKKNSVNSPNQQKFVHFAQPTDNTLEINKNSVILPFNHKIQSFCAINNITLNSHSVVLPNLTTIQSF